MGLTIVGGIQQPHVRPWSTVLRAPTDGGVIWFKASIPHLAHEAAVIEVLARTRPELVPEVLAVERDRGWMLLADTGPTLSEMTKERGDVALWEDALATYAELQIAVSASSEALLRAGAPDRQLVVLPKKFENLIDDRFALRLGSDSGVTHDEHLRLRSLVPRVRALCSELATLGIPETIQHDDLSDTDIALTADGYRFLDWGDACVAHPFFSPFIAMRVLAWRVELEDGAPELERVTAAYLEPWSSYGGRRELLEAFTLAQRLAVVCRALTWRRIVSDLGPNYVDPEGDPVVFWARQVLAAV